ncbi:hypothetical protein ACFPM3_20130 [Streptomyces coeruleoprunus]|uniref:Uncharacterized protein n=1 Tax=Streptomyces coeruleoprunus TaxID=285563 RepID=A0ABV9XJE0_9ACTN
MGVQSERIADSVDELAGWLQAAREWALDADAPKQEREFRAAAYAECINVVRGAFRQVHSALPTRETNDAYAAVIDAPETPETGALWGRAAGTDLASKVLDGLIMALPVDGEDVRSRASLDDPNLSLD